MQDIQKESCVNTGRKFIGIEKDPKNYQISLNRIKYQQIQLNTIKQD